MMVIKDVLRWLEIMSTVEVATHVLHILFEPRSSSRAEGWSSFRRTQVAPCSWLT